MLVGSMFNLATFCLLPPFKILVHNTTLEPDDSISQLFLVGFFIFFYFFSISQFFEMISTLAALHGNTSPALPKLMWYGLVGTVFTSAE